MNATIKTLGRFLAVALVLMSASVAGCIQSRNGPNLSDPASPDGSDSDSVAPPEDDPRYESVHFVRPIILNRTPEDGQVILNITQETRDYSERIPCREEETWALKIRLRVYDRHGPTWSTFYRFGLNESFHRFQVPLEGDPPHLVIGDDSACLGRAALASMVPYWNPRTVRPLREPIHTEFNLTVPPGENRTSVTWTPSPFDHAMVQARPEEENRSGNRYGRIYNVNSRTGEFCRDTFTPTEWEIDCTPPVLYPGSYRIVLELDQPAVQETTWGYFIDTWRLADGMCERGFEWEAICG